MLRCPGQDQRFWKPDDIFEVECPNCGKTVEFFKDEPKIKCRDCGNMVTNPKIDLGCAEWCEYGEQCIGTNKENSGSVCDQLINEMKNVFGDDTKRINHALSVLNFAEKIQAAEGGDALVVKASAILHDIGIHEAERKYNSSAGKYQEIEGPPIAEKILKSSKIPAGTIEHVCGIIANHHTARDIDTKEFRIIWDADWLVNIPDDFQNVTKDKLKKLIDRVFKTNKGYKIAMELFLGITENTD